MRLLPLLATLWITPALAEVPRVVTDIAPIQSLADRVMQGVGQADVILRPGASPHGYSLRPSEAAALQNADLVIWVGHELTPWLGDPLGTLAPNAAQIELLDQPGTVTYPYRERLGHEEEHKEDHKDDNQAGHEAEHDHDHEGRDPHAWLDPVNARVWLGMIATQLAAQDPDNAATYTANASAAQAEIDALTAQITARLSPLAQKPFIVFHDAYQYFETRFGLTASGTISMDGGTSPTAAHVADLRAELAERKAACIFTEPQFDSRLVQNVFGADTRIEQLDPLGKGLTAGPDLYPQLITAMADAFTRCLAE